MAGFVQFLRDAHGVGGRKSKARAGGLLERRGGKRRARRALRFGLRHVAYHESVFFYSVYNPLRLVFLFRFLGAGQHQGRTLMRFGVGGDDIKGFRHKRAYLALALHKYPQCRRLHASGAKAVAHLLPNEARQVVANQAVQHAPRLLRIPQVLVYEARVRQSLGNSLLGDFIKNNAFGLLEPQLLADVPGDSLAFAVGVGRQYHLVGDLRQLPELVYHFLFARHDLVVGDKSALDIDCFFIALRQVAHVAHRCAHDKVARLVDFFQILFDCLRFRGRLDDY